MLSRLNSLLILLLGFESIVLSTQLQANITLSLNETVLIDPSAYFGYQLTGFNITRSQSNSATVLPQIETNAVGEAETEGTQWRFGPSCKAMGFTYFAVIYTHKLEVWKVDGDSLTKEWETVASVGRVINVSFAEVTGFVYWTLPNYLLFVIDLQLPTLFATEVAGADMSNALHLAICSMMPRVVTAYRSFTGIKFSLYRLDYSFHTLVKEGEFRSEEESLIDTFCTSDLYFLTSKSLHLHTRGMATSYPLPGALGPPKSLECLHNCREFFIQAESGVCLQVASVVFSLPIRSVVRATPRLIGLEKVDSRLVLSAWDSHMQFFRVPVDQDIEGTGGLLWLSSDAKVGLMLLKRGKAVRLLTATIDSALISLRGELSPYQVELCAVLACASFTVNALPEDSSGVFIRNSDYYYSAAAISLHYPVNRRHFDVLVNPSTLFSPCLGAEVGSFHLPPFLKLEVCTEHSENVQFQYSPILDNQDAELLCAGFAFGYLNFLFLKGNETIVMNDNKFSTLKAVHGRTWCAVGKMHNFLLKKEENRCFLFYSEHETVEVECSEGEYIAMQLTNDHVIILLRRRVEIFDVLSKAVHRIEGQGEYREVWIEAGLMVLRTAQSFEFYQLEGSRYVLRGIADASPAVTQFVFCDNTLITLSENDILDVYFSTVSLQLVHRFSYSPHCPVQYIASDGFRGVYRCPGYLQFFSCTNLKHSFELQRVPISSNSVPKLQIMELGTLAEIHQENGVWTLWKLVWRSQKDLCFRVAIADEYNVAEAVSFQGEFTISTPDSKQAKIAANFTLENSLQIASTSPKEMEVSWDEEVRLNPLQYFHGKLMEFSAESSNPLITVAVRGPVTVEKLVPLHEIPRFDVQVSEEPSTVFFVKNSEITASRFECSERHCNITSTHKVPIHQFGFQSIYSAEVLFSIKSATYLRIKGIAITPESLVTIVDSIYTFNSDTFSYECKYSSRGHMFRKHYVVQETKSRFHLLLYHYDLVHCVGSANELSCSEEQFPSLFQVVSMAGKAVGTCCYLTALTSDYRLVEMQLCESLTVVNTTSVGYLSPARESMVLGSALLSLSLTGLKVYSLVDHRLLCEIDFFTFPDVVSCNQANSEPRYAWLMADAKAIILDVTAPSFSIAEFPISHFHCIGDNRGAGVLNSTVVIVSLSTGEVVLPREAAQTSGAEGVVTLTARNELSTAAVRFRVIRVPRKSHLWVVAAGAVGSALLFVYRRKKPAVHTDLELQRFY